MSLVPQLFNNEPTRYDHHFGQIIHPDMLSDVLAAPHMLRSMHLADIVGNKGPMSMLTKDGFQLSLDVQQFLPNEITVRSCDNTIVVEGKHDEKDDHCGSITRHFVRKYSLPQDIDIADLQTSLSSDGILNLMAHQRGIGNEHVIQIHQTGPARHSIKH